jgi:hypothetical protein
MARFSVSPSVSPSVETMPNSYKVKSKTLPRRTLVDQTEFNFCTQAHNLLSLLLGSRNSITGAETRHHGHRSRSWWHPNRDR